MFNHPDPRLMTLETPSPVVDLDSVERNLARAQAYFDRHGIRNRPHVKTHKSVYLARRQLDAGAVGITCQKLAEAEIMADGGVSDILVSFPLVGPDKVRRLVELARRIRVSAVVDSPDAVRGIAAGARQAGVSIPLLVECDTGGARCGVQSPDEAAALSLAIRSEEGVLLAGLMTYPPRGQVAKTSAFLAGAIGALRARGLEPGLVSVGGTPDMYSAHELGLQDLGVVQEHRPGTYIFSDRYMVGCGIGTMEDCALRIIATIVSRPTPARAIIDAGSKTFSSDLMGFEDHGMILEYPQASLARLSEEHGHIDLSRSARRPAIGERITIVPNHACAVMNLADRFAVMSAGTVTSLPVDARGKVT